MRLGEQLITSKIEPYSIKTTEKKQEFFNNEENVKLAKTVGTVALAVVALFVAVNLYQTNPANPNPNPANPANPANQLSCDPILIDENAVLQQVSPDQSGCTEAVVEAVNKLIPPDLLECHLKLEKQLEGGSPLWLLHDKLVASICIN